MLLLLLLLALSGYFNIRSKATVLGFRPTTSWMHLYRVRPVPLLPLYLPLSFVCQSVCLSVPFWRPHVHISCMLLRLLCLAKCACASVCVCVRARTCSHSVLSLVQLTVAARAATRFRIRLRLRFRLSLSKLSILQPTPYTSLLTPHSPLHILFTLTLLSST